MTTTEILLQKVEKAMVEVVNSDVDVLRDASRHILLAGGKRIRPRLLLLSYQAAGGQNGEIAISAAAAVELVHTASVVHDDINDHGVVRRGRPSVNAIWGRTFALLTGDFLFTKVYELMAPYGLLNTVLSEATVALVEGETLQASAVKNGTFTREVYYQVIARKTAALFKASAALGARLAEAHESVVNALAEFGFKIGLAFQIIDDLLDLTADTEQLGKTAGIDVAQGRGFAVAYGGAGTGAPVAVVEAVEDDPMDQIRRKALRPETLREAQQQAEHLVQSAIELLDALPDTPFRQDLINLAHRVINRER